MSPVSSSGTGKLLHPLPRTRREFLAEVGRGMLVAAVGYQVAADLGLASVAAEETALSFGSLEPLVCLMQETPIDRLLPALVGQLKSGVDLKRLVAAAALANARTFGGEDYVGFHTLMALAPALHMSQELPTDSQPLPIFKVLYRNTNRIQERGGRKEEVLQALHSAMVGKAIPNGEALRAAVRGKQVELAESTLAALTQQSPEEAFNGLLYAVQDNTEVHRVVLPYRAWDLMGVIGTEQATTLLRQSVRIVSRRSHGRAATFRMNHARSCPSSWTNINSWAARQAAGKRTTPGSSR